MGSRDVVVWGVREGFWVVESFGSIVCFEGGVGVFMRYLVGEVV